MSDVEFQEGDSSLMVDLSAVEEQKFEVLPRGNYNVVVESCEFAFSKSSGKPMWNLRLSVVDGEYANRKLFTFMSFSEKALPMTKGMIARLAPELLQGPFDPRAVAEEDVLLGRECVVKVTIEKYQGNDQNRVKDIMPKSAADSFLEG